MPSSSTGGPISGGFGALSFRFFVGLGVYSLPRISAKAFLFGVPIAPCCLPQMISRIEAPFLGFYRAAGASGKVVFELELWKGWEGCILKAWGNFD